MKRAVLAGENAPPVDLRYLRKPHNDTQNQSQRSSVISFLASVYESVAETLPDFRDEVDSGIEIEGFDEGGQVEGPPDEQVCQDEFGAEAFAGWSRGAFLTPRADERYVGAVPADCEKFLLQTS